MASAMIMSLAVAAPLAMMLLVALVTPLVVLATVLAPRRNVHIVVPTVLNEINRPAAGVVLMAMFAPMLRMTRRDVQIKGLRDNNGGRRRRNQHGTRVDHRRPWSIADVDASVKTRLINRDGNTDIRAEGRS